MRRFGRRSPAPPVSESGDDRTQPDSQPIGLFQLWPDPELSGSAGIEIDIDVVAVHGLGGHAYKTWTEGQKLWLRDFIPKDLPRARILTFGYNAGLAFTKSTSTIRDFAVQLLESLRQLRRRTANDSVKTIFVCHSLGGIVVKQALIVAHERSVTYGSVASSVRGVVFLGTPHRGSDIAYWSGLLTKVANIAVLGRLRQDLLDNLRPKSAELGTICAQFVERGIGLQIFSLYERLTMPVINALVVDEMSAILHLPNETAIPLEADHQGMCKFLTSSNPNYIVVRDCIDEIIETLARVSGSSFFTPSQDMFMRRLRVINEVDMLQRVPSSWGKSHEWLINHQSFKSWTGYQGVRVLWMYGGPGSGKTVLSKTIVLYLNQISESGPDTGIIRKPVYFFFDDKDPKTQTSTAFVSSVLYQILEDTKTAYVIRYLDNTHLNISQPDEDTLWQCLLWIIERSRGIIFQFVVDAIDELYRIRETSSVTLLERLEGLLAADVSGHMRLLITDRKVPDEGFLRSAGPSLIDVENTSTRQVVEEYIRAQVRRRLEIARINPQAGAEVESKIVEISGGNFLMASLTWKQFADGIQIWSRDAIRLRIKEIHRLPRDLETIYCGLLNNLPLQWREEARKAFSILRISFERLSSKQLSLFVTIWKFDCSSSNFDLRAVEDERSDFEIYLHERCGYIIRKNENGLVNFAHQSAKDLFNGQSQLQSNAGVLNQYTVSEPDAHLLLFLMCMKVLQAEARFLTKDEIIFMIRQTRDEVDKLDLPLEKRFVKRVSTLKSKIHAKSWTTCLLYALSNWFEHYVKATPSVEWDKVAVHFFQSYYYSRYHMLWAEISIFSEAVAQHIEIARSPFFPLLSAITRGDSRRLIKAIIESGASANITTGPEDITPLSWAIICNRQDAFLALMRSDTVSVNFGKNSRSIAVHYAASSPNPFYINYMVEDSRANLNCRGKDGRTPLLEAIRNKRLDSVLLLLEQPYIDVWAADDYQNNALTMAFQHQMWENVVLKIMRMNWNRAMSTARSNAELLELARMHRWSQVEDELLSKRGRTLFQVDEYTGLNPVSALVFYGRRTDFVHYLTKLSRDEISVVASSGRYNLLHLCAHQDWYDLVEQLMNRYSLRPLANDHANRTLLHWALEYSWPIDESQIQVLTAGNINQKDNDGMTPLHLAVFKHNMTIIRWLVAAQSDIFSRDNRGFTPAHLAANEGYREGVEFFMGLTKRDFGKSRDGSSLIHLMSLWLDGSVIRRFVESRRTSVNSRDKKRCTPLHCAAQTGNVSAVKVLLEKGCQVDAKDLYGQTALHHAIRSGESEVPPILLQNDADMDLKDLYEQTCLHLSIRHRHEELTKWLISRKQDMVFERDKFGFTPLHRACSNGTASEVMELLHAGADILELDSNFRTPLEHAIIGRNQSTATLILQYRQTDDYRAREWIRSLNTALRTSTAKGFPEIEAVLMEAGARVADRSKIEIERFYVPDDIREDRWPLVTYRDWDRAYHADSYDPSTGSARDNAGKQEPGK